MRRGSRRGARTVGAALVLAATTVCVVALVAYRGSSPTPLAHTTSSPEALGAAVLAAVHAGDVASLEALALSAGEFRDYVWPELPISEPRRNFPFDFVWGLLQQNSRTHLRQTLAHFKDHGFQLVGVRFAGTSSEYDGVTVHRETELVVRDEAGVERRIRVFGSTIEQAGRFKVFSYVIDD